MTDRTARSLLSKADGVVQDIQNTAFTVAEKLPSPPEGNTSVNLVKAIMEQNRKNNGSIARRYNLFPIKDWTSYAFYKKQEASVWTANEIDFIRDRDDYKNLSDKERHLVDLILAFFAPGDGLVSNNLSMRFILGSATYEEQAFFIAQMFIELVHAETYGMLIATIITDEKKKEELFNLVDNVECVKAKAEFMEYYTEQDVPECDRFAAFAAAEGIFFSVLFMFIFWFRSKGKMQSLVFANEQISKDECLHRDFGAYKWRMTSHGDPDAPRRAIEIVMKAVAIERRFIDYLFSFGDVDELTVASSNQYLETVADSLFYAFGLPAVFNAKVPFPWMGDISMTQKSNFYEIRVGAYSRFSVDEALDKARQLSGEANEQESSVSESIYDNTDDVEF